MPRAIVTVGVPGSGKTTFARSLDPAKWVTLSLDDFRAALWGSKKTYHNLTAHDWGTGPAKVDNPLRQLLHQSYRGALSAACKGGWDMVLANTHLFLGSFQLELNYLRKQPDYEVSLLVFQTPLDELLARNEKHGPEDWCHPDYIRSCYDALHAKDAWGREFPNKEFA